MSSPLMPLRVETQEVSGDYGRFVVEPLEPGTGATIGNALRRTLLSSLPGAAVTWVRVEGALHEFSGISHMKEDMIELLLNIKGIRLRPLSNRPGKLFLEAAGEGVVTAGDIKPSAEFEVTNPELYLATLDSPEAKLSAEFNVEQGKGYLRGRSDGLPPHALPVDAIFSPVRRVNYEVKPSAVAQEPRPEQLALEVWTDGTIGPAEAVSKAASLLVGLFAMFEDLTRPAGRPLPRRRVPLPPDQVNRPIEELELSVRTFNALKRGGINTLGELLEKDERELLELRQFGPKAQEEVREKLRALGLLPPEEEEKEEEKHEEEEEKQEEEK